MGKRRKSRKKRIVKSTVGEKKPGDEKDLIVDPFHTQPENDTDDEKELYRITGDNLFDYVKEITEPLGLEPDEKRKKEIIRFIAVKAEEELKEKLRNAQNLRSLYSSSHKNFTSEDFRKGLHFYSVSHE